jgi:hypothetical protein
VKLSLRTFITDFGATLPIDSAVAAMKQLTVEAYMLANAHVLRLMRDKMPLPELDQTFFYRCMCEVSSSPTANDAALEVTATLYRSRRSPRTAPADRSLVRGIMSNAAIKMATATKNNVAMELYKRLRRHLRSRLDMDGKEANHILKDIFAIEYLGRSPVVLHFRQSMPPPTKANMIREPHLFMPVMYEMQQFTERNYGLQGTKSFSLLPMSSGFASDYIAICNVGLHCLLRHAGATVPSEQNFLSAGFADERALIWRKVFNIGSVETENRHFNNIVLTDGKAVSIVLRRQRTVQDRLEEAKPRDIALLNANDYDTVWGLDPGMRDMFVATDTYGVVASCSSSEFYEDAKYRYRTRTTKKWTAANAAVTEIVRSFPRKKTSDVDVLLAYVDYTTRHMATLFAFYGAKRIKNLKFKCYCAAKKKLHALCKRLTERSGQRTLVGFGDFSLTTTRGVIKGCRPGPSGRLRKELKKYCACIDIDEYRTSKVCSCCRQRSFRNMVHRKTDEESGLITTTKVHCVLHCETSGCLSVTMNRDVNASRNILELTECVLHHRARPACFERSDEFE